MKLKEWFKKRKIVFMITIPNIIIIYMWIRLFRKATLIESPELKIIVILLMVVIVELVIMTWINIEYHQRFLDKMRGGK